MKQKLYDFTLDFDDGSPEGVHLHGTGPARGVALQIARRAPQMHTQFESKDGSEEKNSPVLVFLNERAANDGEAPIGRITFREEVQI
jgi:hypothetical protein